MILGEIQESMSVLEGAIDVLEVIVTAKKPGSPSNNGRTTISYSASFSRKIFLAGTTERI
jgi:hypothetical protein